MAVIMMLGILSTSIKLTGDLPCERQTDPLFSMMVVGLLGCKDPLKELVSWPGLSRWVEKILMLSYTPPGRCQSCGGSERPRRESMAGSG